MKKPILIVRIGPGKMETEEVKRIRDSFKDVRDDIFVVVYNQEGAETKITLISDEKIKVSEVS